MAINLISLEGQLVSSIKQIQKDSINFGVFSFVTNINKKNRFIKVLIFAQNSFLNEKAQNYIIEANKGKKLCVTGKLSFDSMDNLQILANDIEFIDKYIDQTTIDSNKVVFDENELP